MTYHFLLLVGLMQGLYRWSAARRADVIVLSLNNIFTTVPVT